MLSTIFDAEHVVVIAEVGVNHNGDLDTALALVDAAVDAGADVVKFQTFRAENLVTRAAPKADYQLRQTGGGGQYELLKPLELSDTDHHALLERCRQRGVVFLSTPFDLESLAFLVDELGQRIIKISSGDMTNAPLLLDIARRKCTVIMSTGMATLEEVERALGVLAFGYMDNKSQACGQGFKQAFASSHGQNMLRENVSLLHCTTEYPAPLESINLRAMKTMAKCYGIRVGLSDHSDGASAVIAAVGMGATIIEKHITLDCSMVGADHKASMEPVHFKAMVKAIREAQIALGGGVKKPVGAEMKNMAIARKSLVAARAISKGEIFNEQNLTVKRPGNGISALDYFDWIGRRAERNFDADEVLSE